MPIPTVSRVDAERPDAWRYRDYVVRSFNQDKPYDRFLREQIAGDELFPGDKEALAGAGVSARRAAPRGRRQSGRRDEPAGRPGRDDRRHRLHLPGPDGRLRALPQPQVRPDSAVRLLPSAGRSSPPPISRTSISRPKQETRGVRGGEEGLRSAAQADHRADRGDRETVSRAAARGQGQKLDADACRRLERAEGAAHAGAAEARQGSRRAAQAQSGTKWCTRSRPKIAKSARRCGARCTRSSWTSRARPAKAFAVSTTRPRIRRPRSS